jgi:hypothetical protein
MKEWRSASQILFGFLPEQTVDLAGRVWKVREWRNPVMKHIDPTTLRREVIKAAMPWAVGNTDADYVKHLRQGRDLYAFALDRSNGVNVDEFPKVWMCKQRACNRVYFSSAPHTCKCGGEHFGQLPFVGYHSCGDLREPWVRRCAQHDDIAIRLPGTASAAEIVFYCPSPGCGRELQKGLGFLKCACGAGTTAFNVHRASPVYTPQTVVIVNPPSEERVKRLNEAGGGARALAWALGGFEARRPEDVGLTLEGLVRDLVSKGLSEAVARMMARQAVDAGELKGSAEEIDVPEPQREEATAEAVTVAMALDQSRQRISDLAARIEDDWSERANVYRHLYPLALEKAGLDGIELVEKFPVLTGHFGYTRGGGGVGQGRLRPFQRDRKYIVYSDVAETEALFVRLRPSLVVRWLAARGYPVGDAGAGEREARLAILRQADVPARGEDRAHPSVGSEVLTLVHSFAHRFIRRIAVFAGIDRNALSELVVPRHLGFFVYAAARGDFVLGGLQAVFESELHHVLYDVVGSDHRCPLDPGCQRVGAACVACLHLGEPSCRYFNRYLNREHVFGPAGFLLTSWETATREDRANP